MNEASPAVWVEAGYLTADTAPIRDWFETLWRSCRTVTDADLAAAKIAWARRQKLASDSRRDLTPKFAEYKVGKSDFPLITWCSTTSTFESNSAVVQAAPASERDQLEKSIDDGIEIEDEADRPCLSEGRWVLRFVLRNDGQIVRQHPQFVRLGRTVENAGRNEGEALMPVVLPSTDRTGRPFDEREPQFITAFRELIEFAGLRGSAQPELRRCLVCTSDSQDERLLARSGRGLSQESFGYLNEHRRGLDPSLLLPR